MKNSSRKSNNTPLLRLQNISKNFISSSGIHIEVLKFLNIDIETGQLISIVGGTGTGKTTLLNLIAGLYRPDNGIIKPNKYLNLKNDLAYVFQHYTLLPWRTVIKNITFGLQLRNISKSRRMKLAIELIEQVGLNGFEEAFPHELSGGMRQRTAIAQALAIRPKLLLMDEPFGALDDSTRSELQQMLIRLWQEYQMTIIFVTHNIDEAIILGDRVLVLSERPGRISHEFKLDLPRPRDRMAEEFTNLFIEVRQSLSGQLD